MSGTKKKSGKPMRTAHEQLAEEAAKWDATTRLPESFRDAPAAVPRVNETEAISLRMPKTLLALLRGFAEREGVGYQVLIKRWIDDRLRSEREKLRAARRAADAATKERSLAPTFPMVDRREGERSHYQMQGH